MCSFSFCGPGKTKHKKKEWKQKKNEKKNKINNHELKGTPFHRAVIVQIW